MEKIETLIIHKGRNPKKSSGMVNPPIYKSSTIIYPTVEEFLKDDYPIHTDKTYGRTGTPTTAMLEELLAELSGSDHAIVTASGMAAITVSLLTFLRAGDHVLATDAIYKCTRRLLDDELQKLNITHTYFNPNITTDIEKLIQPNTKVIFLESPGSNTFEIQDIQTICKIAKKHNIITIVDNSWGTPLLSQPIKWGADVVLESATKYISGSSDTFMGFIAVNKKHFKNVHNTFVNLGAITTPDNCYTILRSLRSLPTRLKQHQENAIVVAKFLESHKKIEQVFYPPLPSFSGHKKWKKYFSGASSVFSFVVKTNSDKQLYKFIDNLKLFAVGLSWGGYESLIIPINIATRIERFAPVFKGKLIRIHIGLENPSDLVLDLNNALKNI